MLKADMHLHSEEDKADKYLKYSAKNLIDKAHKLGFEVLSFTFHNVLFYSDDVIEYAKQKNILLIPGMEKTIEGKHVLLYNFKQEELDKIRHFEDLRIIKKDHHLIIAPHPFFKQKSCLGRKLIRYKNVFDGVEFSFCYSKLVNFNTKAKKFAERNNKTFIANSDTHFLEDFGNHYSFIDGEKSIDGVIKAIKEGKVKVQTKALTTLGVAKVVLKHKIKGMV